MKYNLQVEDQFPKCEKVHFSLIRYLASWYNKVHSSVYQGQELFLTSAYKTKRVNKNEGNNFVVMFPLSYLTERECSFVDSVEENSSFKRAQKFTFAQTSK